MTFGLRIYILWIYPALPVPPQLESPVSVGRVNDFGDEGMTREAGQLILKIV